MSQPAAGGGAAPRAGWAGALLGGLLVVAAGALLYAQFIRPAQEEYLTVARRLDALEGQERRLQAEVRLKQERLARQGDARLTAGEIRQLLLAFPPPPPAPWPPPAPAAGGGARLPREWLRWGSLGVTFALLLLIVLLPGRRVPEGGEA